MARPARPERSRSARSSRQLSRFYHSIIGGLVVFTGAAVWRAPPAAADCASGTSGDLVGANLLRLNGRCPLKERDQLLENLHPMPIDLPSQSIIEASCMGMNRIPVG